MSNATINQANEQFQSLFGEPARAFAELTVNHMESVVQTQVEASRALSDLSMKQVRSALEVKDPKDVQSFFQGQQEFLKAMSEQVRGDAEKLVELNRKFAEEAQKLGQQSTQEASKAATKAASSASTTGNGSASKSKS